MTAAKTLLYLKEDQSKIALAFRAWYLWWEAKFEYRAVHEERRLTTLVRQ